MLDLKTLKDAFSQIEDVGKGEITFDLDGIPVTLRVLLPTEEVLVQKFASKALAEGDEGDNATTADYLERFKVAVCSHSMVAVSDLDFRDSEYVETGEVLANGVAVKIPRYQAVRQILGSFSRGATTILFKKYGELLSQVEKEAETATDFEVVDHDAEIERLQAQIKELQEQKEQAADGPSETVMSSTMNEAVRSAAEDIDRAQNWGKERRARRDEREKKYEEDKARIENLRETENLKETVTQGEVYQEQGPEQPRRSVIPERATPLMDYPPTDEPVATEHSVGEPVDQGVQHLQHLGQEVDPETPDSFMGDDPEAEIQRENDRLARIRAAKAQQQRDLRNQQAVAPVRSGRRPPHMAAKDVAEEIVVTETKQVGDIDGIPAYRVGQPQELNDKFGQTQPNPSVDPSDKQQGTQNPRFRPPKQP